MDRAVTGAGAPPRGEGAPRPAVPGSPSAAGPTPGSGDAFAPPAGVPGRRAFWLLLVWLPLCYALAAEPAVETVEAGEGWPRWAVLGLVVASFTAAVLLVAVRRWVPEPTDGQVPPVPAACAPLLAVQGLATVGAALAYGDAWLSLFILLGIGVGVAGRPGRATLGALVLVTVLAAVTGAATAGVGQVGAVTLTTALAGFGTYAFHRLFSVISELAATRAELARVAVSEERARFSRDLHDLLGHTLSVVVVKAEVVRRVAARDPDAAAAHAGDIEEIGRRALDEVRQAVTGYRTTSLAAELDHARTACAAAGVALEVSAEDEGLPPAAATLLAWAVREGVTNVLRHADASRCRVEVRRTGSGVRLTVDDDGRGAGDGAGDETSGTGLPGLRERVTAVGGTLTAGPAREGFRLTVEVPVTAVGAS